jgi:alpha-D-ribose 1-methylphosphonate 5-triphosphate synthase subunit PhnL
MSASLPALRQAQIDNILHTVADGNCRAVYGSSNTGQSPLLRALAVSAAE